MSSFYKAVDIFVDTLGTPTIPVIPNHTTPAPTMSTEQINALTCKFLSILALMNCHSLF